MGLVDKLQRTFGLGYYADNFIEVGHIGLTVGAHGRSLAEADDETRHFVDKLIQASDKTNYFLQRINLTEKPLKLVIIGRDYCARNNDAIKLTKKLSTENDLILSAEKKDRVLEARIKRKEIRFNGIRSMHLTPKEDQEIYGPYMAQPSETNDYISKTMLNYCGSDNFDKVYQHRYFEGAKLSEGRRHKEDHGEKYVTTYDRTLVSAAEKAGLSYAVLMPKRFFSFGKWSNPHIYKEVFEKTAALEFADIEDLLEK